MEAIKQWHLNLRETVVKSNKEGNEQYDPVFGRYRADRRFNVKFSLTPQVTLELIYVKCY